MQHDAMDRQQSLALCSKTQFDVIVIGGGITGAGIFRELCLAGQRVLLVEARDFASGTSSRSTKLVHGGIRYLQQGHWQLVREAARERQRIAEIAPHLAEPTDLLLIAANGWLFLKYLVGVVIYEFLGKVSKKDRHQKLWGARLRESEPLLDQQHHPFGIMYREYLTDDARLVIANVRAGLALGGEALNYLPVEKFLWDGAAVVGVQAKDHESGEVVDLRAAKIVNAAGPWVQSILDLDGASHKKLTLSKGVHVVIARSDLDVHQSALVVASDGRPIFVIPKQDTVYVGTTDSAYTEPEMTWPRVQKDEVNYLLKTVNHHFNTALTPKDCLSSWAGLRPLIAAEGQKTSEISRKDEIWESTSGLITIAGGKLTGYRKMAERVVARLIDKEVHSNNLKSEVPKFLPGGCDLKTLKDVEARLVASSNLSPQLIHRLIQRYGCEAEDVIELGHVSIVSGAMVIEGEVRWGVRIERARHLEDVVYRRIRTPWSEPLMTDAGIVRMSEIMAHEMCWDESTRITELERVRQRLAEDVAFIS
ncbi:MAG: glycerol-3-phosphate dehydrogenase/oxidase [Pseudomonadales bacterium]